MFLGWGPLVALKSSSSFEVKSSVGFPQIARLAFIASETIVPRKDPS
jgi:hypothetical protein